MKLTSIEIRPENSSDVAILSFRDPTAQNPYNIKAISGLDAEEIVPKYYGASGTRKFYTLSLQRRDLVFKVGLNPNFSQFKTYSDLRSDLYRMISSSRTGKVEVQFKYQTTIVAAVTGFILKFESPLFEKTQEVQFTIKCDEPLLSAKDAVSIIELPTNRTTIDDSLSTAPHGFSSTFTILEETDLLKINDPDDASWDFVIEPWPVFSPGDKLYFSSELNNKQLYVIRDDETIQLAEYIIPGSIWPLIFPGNNTFSFNYPANLTWDILSYYPTYWGV